MNFYQLVFDQRLLLPLALLLRFQLALLLRFQRALLLRFQRALLLRFQRALLLRFQRGFAAAIFSRLGVFVICHFSSEQELEFKTTFAGGIGEGFDLTCEEEATAIEDNSLNLGVSGTLGN